MRRSPSDDAKLGTKREWTSNWSFAALRAAAKEDNSSFDGSE